MNKQVLIGLSTLSLVTILSGVALSSSNSSAASASTATAAVKIAASCTLTSTGGGNYSATVPNGTSAEIPGSTLSVSCNDAGGFALYAVGYSNDTIGNNNMIGQSTNIATNTSGNDSYWAMKINPTTGTTPTIENSFNNYHIVPNAHTKVASYTSSTGTGSLSVNATYKANISSTQLAGNYLGKVKYTLIHPATGPAPAAPLAASDCPKYSICYAPNADDIEGTMRASEFSTVAASTKAGRQTNRISINHTTEAILAAYNYSRPGYGFAGWSQNYNASAAPGSTDVIYGPQASVFTGSSVPEVVDFSTKGLILYPVWVASTGTMQTFSTSDCNAMNIGDVTARTDIRDGNTYTIAKLVDGKCWMVENLRLSNDENITPSNTHSNNGAFGGVFTGLAKSENANYECCKNPPVPNSLYSADGSTANVISGGDSSYWHVRMPRYNNNNTNRSLTPSHSKADNSSAHLQWYGYGNLYTWAAAIADTNHYNTNNQSVETTSLCPTGWRLPRGGGKTNEANNEYWNLIVNGLNNGTKPANYSSKDHPYYTGSTEGLPIDRALRAYPNNFVYSDNYYQSSAPFRGYRSEYWTSTAKDDSTSYILSMSRTYDTNFNIYPGSSDGAKFTAGSIRCIAGT